MSITLNEKTCLSVSRRRLCLRERCDLLEKERGDLLSQVVRMHRLEFCWTDEKSELLMCARQKLTDTNFKLITTEEVLRNLGEIVDSRREELLCAQAEEL